MKYQFHSPRNDFFPKYDETALNEMTLQVESYLHTPVSDTMDFRTLHYKWARVKETIEQMKKQQQSSLGKR